MAAEATSSWPPRPQVQLAKSSIEAEFSTLLAAKQGMAEKVAEQVQRLEKHLVSSVHAAVMQSVIRII